jgi:hypothetical protein
MVAKDGWARYNSMKNGGGVNRADKKLAQQLAEVDVLES